MEPPGERSTLERASRLSTPLRPRARSRTAAQWRCGHSSRRVFTKPRSATTRCSTISRIRSAALPQDDEAGRRWSKGAPLRRLHQLCVARTTCRSAIRRSRELAKLLTRHASAFAEECAFELPRKPRLDSLWVNLLQGGGHHSGHIHPHSIISGTFYVEVADKGRARSVSRTRACR